jgi:hypothetical protein
MHIMGANDGNRFPHNLPFQNFNLNFGALNMMDEDEMMIMMNNHNMNNNNINNNIGDNLEGEGLP